MEIESGGEPPRVRKRVARASVSMPRTSATRVGTERSRTVAFFSNASKTVGELMDEELVDHRGGKLEWRSALFTCFAKTFFTGRVILLGPSL